MFDLRLVTRIAFGHTLRERMNFFGLLWRVGGASLLMLTGCAVAGSGSGAGSGGAGGAGSGSSGNANTVNGSGAADSSASSGSNASGAGGGGAECNAPEHWCGGICVGNTEATGCYQSQSCESCPYVEFGTNKCTDDGWCDFDCETSYQKSGNQCVCTLECCTQADCPSNHDCTNGSCIEQTPPCDDLLCTFDCIFQGYTAGICQNGLCVCL